MVRRRPITSHPAFVPLVVLWFTALLGLGVAVLPAPLLERVLGAVGVQEIVQTPTGRLAASVAAALIGGLLGLALTLPLARRGARDPRPIYAEADLAMGDSIPEEPVRRPLRVREEFDDLAHEAVEPPLNVGRTDSAGEFANPEASASLAQQSHSELDEGFMILSPQPVHPPRPAPDLQALLDQFDNVIASFRDQETSQLAPSSSHAATAPSDPVHAFVARQTGAPTASPLGGRIPDHQAELRAALDKLARSQRDR